jgi:5-methylcytosine-specific restriction endonuclease McrA
MSLAPEVHEADETEFFTCKYCEKNQPLSEFHKTPSGHRHKCKTCRRTTRKANYEANRQHYITYSVEWNHENRDRHNELHRESYQRNKDVHRERLRRWRAEHPHAHSQQQERAKEAEKRRGYPNAQERRALAHKAFVEFVDKETLYDLYEGQCAICLRPLSYTAPTFDHIVPLARGGLHCYDNVQIAHMECNRRKGTKLMEEMDDSLRFAPHPKKKERYRNNSSYRQSQNARSQRLS